MKKLVYSVLLVLLVGVAQAQVATSSSLKTTANAMARAMVAQDYTMAADLTYQFVHDVLGGKQATADHIREIVDKMSMDGVRLIEMTFLESEQSAIVDGQLHAVVPYIGVLKIRNGKLQFRSFYYAISGNNGASWTLVDGGKLTSESMNVLFPAYKGIPKLPPKGKPIFIPDSDGESN